MKRYDVFEDVLQRVQAGEDVADAKVIEALAMGSVLNRAEANARLAQAYLETNRPDQAFGSAERSWLLGHHSNTLRHFLIRYLVAAGRQRDALDRLREAVATSARLGDLDALCDATVHFHSLAAGLDLPIHDPFVTEAVTAALRPTHVEARAQPNGPLRIGYIFWGDEQENNVLPPILIELARHHDRQIFNPVFFSIHSEDYLSKNNKTFQTWRKKIRGINAEFFGNEPAQSFIEAAQSISRKIAKQNIDILIPLGQMGISFLVAALRPAPLIVGLDLGHPHIYSSPALDHVINPSPHRHTMEELCDATKLQGTYTAYDPVPPTPLARASIGAFETDVIVTTSGSDSKFENESFLRCLGEVATESEKVRLYLIGPSPESSVHNFFRQNFSDEICSRIHLTGFRQDFSAFLRASDIYVDSYPVGGGYALLEALSAGIPVVTFSQKISGIFRKMEHYTPGAVLCDGTGMVVCGDDVSHIKKRLLDLVAHPDMRRRLGGAGLERIGALIDTRQFMASMESVLLTLARARSMAPPRAIGFLDKFKIFFRR